MKICMLSTMYLRYKNDTRGLMVSETNRNLINQGIEVEVVAPNDYGYTNRETIEGVKINRFNYFWPKRLQRLAYGSGIPTNIRKSFLAKIQIPLFSLSFLWNTIKVSKKCDIIHAQWIFSGFIGLLAKKITRKPVVVTVRRVNNKGLMRLVNKYVLNNADYIIYNSNYTKRESLKIAKPKRSKVIWNSLDTEKFKPMKTDLKRKLGLKNKKVIFSMGLLVEKKGFPYLIKAMQTIIKKHPDAVLVIGGHGKEEKNLKDLVKNLTLQNYVKFVGRIESDKTPEYYNIADVFVLPSIIDSKGETETLGVVLMEAMACAKPVIGSAVGGILDVIKPECGVLVKPNDSNTLSDKIIYLLGNPEKMIKLGKEGRKHILDSFAWKKKAFINIYGDLLK